MPLSRRVALFNKRVTNHVTRPFAAWLPGFGVVTHVGRRSGREYRIPVNLFRRDGRFVFALTYSSEAEWVKNVRAAGGCTVRTRGNDVALTAPELVVDRARRPVPMPARWILGLVHVDEFLVLDRAPGPNS